MALTGLQSVYKTLFQWNKVIKFPIGFISSVYSITATIASTYGHARPSAENANKSEFFIACRDDGGVIVASIPNYWMASGLLYHQYLMMGKQHLIL